MQPTEGYEAFPAAARAVIRTRPRGVCSHLTDGRLETIVRRGAGASANLSRRTPIDGIVRTTALRPVRSRTGGRHTQHRRANQEQAQHHEDEQQSVHGCTTITLNIELFTMATVGLLM